MRRIFRNAGPSGRRFLMASAWRACGHVKESTRFADGVQFGGGLGPVENPRLLSKAGIG